MMIVAKARDRFIFRIARSKHLIDERNHNRWYVLFHRTEDIIDTAISPFSGGTSQPATETLAYALRQLGYEVDLDDTCTKQIADYFKTVRDEYIADGTLIPKALATDTQCLTYQIPGGMLSNLLSQLKQMNALDKFDIR